MEHRKIQGLGGAGINKRPEVLTLGGSNNLGPLNLPVSEFLRALTL